MRSINWRSVVVASVMAALTYSVLTGAGAQQKGEGGKGKGGGAAAAPANTGPFDGRPLKEAIVGSWRLLIVDQVKPDNTQVPLFGPNPRGLAMFGQDGQFSLQIVRDIGRTNFAANDRLKGTPAEIKAAYDGMFTTFGGYTVNDQDKGLTMRVEGAAYPNFTDTTQKYVITALWQDDFTWNVPLPATGSDKIMVAWRRIK